MALAAPKTQTTWHLGKCTLLRSPLEKQKHQNSVVIDSFKTNRGQIKKIFLSEWKQIYTFEGLQVCGFRFSLSLESGISVPEEFQTNDAPEVPTNSQGQPPFAFFPPGKACPVLPWSWYPFLVVMKGNQTETLFGWLSSIC